MRLTFVEGAGLFVCIDSDAFAAICDVCFFIINGPVTARRFPELE